MKLDTDLDISSEAFYFVIQSKLRIMWKFDIPLLQRDFEVKF